MKMKIEDTSSADYLSARIKSTILYPEVTKDKNNLYRDEEHAEGRERAFWSFYLNNLSVDAIEKIVTPHFVMFLNESESLAFYNRKWDSYKKKMFTVYSLMSLIYSGTIYHGEPMSYLAAVEKYVNRARTECEIAPLMIDLDIFIDEVCSEFEKVPADRKYKINTSSVKNHWNELKAVAHLCAAWYAVKPNRADNNSERLANLLDVLILAKELREFGVNHFVPKSRKPLLDPEIAWSIPDLPELIGFLDEEKILLSESDYEYYSFNNLSVESFEGLD